MSKIILNSANFPDAPAEGQVVLFVSEGTLYAWTGPGEGAPVALGAPMPAKWTAQFSGTASAGQQGVKERVGSPYPTAIGGRVAGVAVYVEENSLDALSYVTVSGVDTTGLEFEAEEIGSKGLVVASKSAGVVGVLEVGINSDGATTGSITVHVTVAFESVIRL